MKNKMLKNIKTIVSYTLALLVIVSSLGFVSVTHATGATLTIGSQSASNGATINVPVTASNFVDIAGVTLTGIQFDNTLIRYEGYTLSALPVSGSLVNLVENQINVNWSDQAHPMNVGSGAILTLNFTVISAVATNTSISFEGTNEISDSVANIVSTTFTDGVISLNPATLSSIATVTSSSYTIGANTITNVPFGTSKATFLATLSKGQDNQTWNDSGINNLVVTGNTLVVTAQDGVTTETYTVTVNAPSITLSSLEITTPASKLSYTVSDVLDITGLVVTGHYSDGSTQTETIAPSDVSGFNSSTLVTGQVLTITVNGITTTYTVDIVVGPSNLTTLTAAIVSAQALHDGATEEGTIPGQYTVGSKAILQSAINAAMLLTLDDTQANINNAVTVLTTAVATFNSSIVGDSDLTALSAAIASAQALNDGATEGTAPGEYAVGSKLILQVAIDTAIHITSAEDQFVVNSAITTLNDAVAVFNSSVVGDSDVSALNIAIASAQAIDLSAVAGTAPGQYPASAKTTLETAIALAQTVNASTDQSIVDATIVTLNDAVSAFQAIVIGPSDLSVLSAAIVSAQTLHDTAVEGNLVGQYPAPLKANLKTTIDTASAITPASAQSVVDAMVITLNNSVSTFEAGVVIPDTIAPVITLVGGSSMSVTVGNTFSDPGATASDNVDGNITANIVVGGDTVDTNTIGVYTITYTATDVAENVATPITRIVHVVAVVILNSIAITTPANELSFTVGDVLDISGLVVTGTYSDATTKVETVTVSNISGFDSSIPVVGQVLTITVGGKTATYTINIVTAHRNSGGSRSATPAVPATKIEGCKPGSGDLFDITSGKSCTISATPATPGQVLGATSFNFTLFMKNGSKGNEVVELQKFLTTLGYTLTADGKFGPKTKAVVIKFQLANGLVGDGIIGVLTRAVLNK